MFANSSSPSVCHLFAYCSCEHVHETQFLGKVYTKALTNTASSSKCIKYFCKFSGLPGASLLPAALARKSQSGYKMFTDILRALFANNVLANTRSRYSDRCTRVLVRYSQGQSIVFSLIETSLSPSSLNINSFFFL